MESTSGVEKHAPAVVVLLQLLPMRALWTQLVAHLRSANVKPSPDASPPVLYPCLLQQCHRALFFWRCRGLCRPACMHVLRSVSGLVIGFGAWVRVRVSSRVRLRLGIVTIHHTVRIRARAKVRLNLRGQGYSQGQSYVRVRIRIRIRLRSGSGPRLVVVLELVLRPGAGSASGLGLASGSEIGSSRAYFWC